MKKSACFFLLLSNLFAIDVAFVCSDGYAHILATAIASIVESANKDDHVFVHIVNMDFTDGTKQKLKKLESDQVKIAFVHFDNNIVSEYESKRYNSIVFAKAIVPRLLKHLDKVLLLDGDIVVLQSLSKLWETDLGEHIAAVVQSQYLRGVRCTMYTLRHLVNTKKQFNSGVMLINVKKYVKDDMEHKFFEEIHRINHIGDESAFVNIFNGNTVFLPVKWNLCPIMMKHSYKYFADFSMYQEEEFLAAISNPAIVHFADSSFKSIDHRYQERFMYFLGKTPFTKEFASFSKANEKIVFMRETSLRSFVVSKVTFLYQNLRKIFRNIFEN